MRKRCSENQPNDPRDRHGLEPLENRLLLSVTDVSGSIGDVKNGPMANSGPELISLYRTFHTYTIGGGAASKFTSTDTNILVNDGDVAVTVRGKSSLDNITNDVRAVGGAAIARDSGLKTVDAAVPISELHLLATEKDVISVTPIIKGQLASVGAAANQADQAENADKARSLYGLDGTGVKVGVLSDSVDQTGLGIAGSIDTGDLPANGIQVIQDDTDPTTGPTDEGRAMLELVHDIAPGASLAFATGLPSQTVLANNIQRLAASGANVIVDDIGFPTEPMFQPGVVDDAINNAVQHGVTYVSAAFNNANAGYEAPTNFVTQNGVTDVNFASDGTVQTRMQISFPQAARFAGDLLPFVMEWDNPYNGVTGNATSDLDVYFYDPHNPTRVLAVANANNLATGLPLEVTDVPARTLDVEIRLVNHVAGTPLPSMFKFVFPTDGLVSLTTPFPQNQNSIFGHDGGQYGISVGAVDYKNAPPFATPNMPIPNETFSSNGPDTILFDANGTRLATPLVLDKPDVSGIDDVDTSFFPADAGSSDANSLPNFQGTSAAAPNVAAVVALIKQASPTATQAQILSALQLTARPVNSTPIGQWNPQGGFGLIDAQAAIAQFVPNPTAQIVQVTPNPTDAPISSIKIVFSQQVSGFDISDLILSVDGGPNLLTANNGPNTTDGGRTWIVGNLQSATDVPGLYDLELKNVSGLVVNHVGLPFVGDDTMQFTNIGPQARPAPPSNLSVKALSDSATQLHWADNSTNDDGFLIQRATDPAFTTGVRDIRVAHGVTTFTDSSLASGTTYYYRVRAFNNFSGNSTYTNVANATTLSAGEVILDNASNGGVKIVGNWESSTATPGFYGSDYLDDQNTDKGDDSVTFRPNLSATGDYFVYARWTSGPDRATNVPFNVNGKKITVNERDTGGSGWVLLGKFSFKAGTSGTVTISNAGTNGLVVADAIEFLPADANMV